MSKEDPNFIPKKLSEYRAKEYWESRYKQSTEKSYDWLLDYPRVKSILLPHLQKSYRILNLGCGNSTLARNLCQDGFESIVNIDYSPTVIDQMSNSHRDLPSLTWITMDMRQLVFEQNSFDLIIDKGSLDAIWTDGGSLWDPSDAIRADVCACIDSILRVLKNGGKFVSISFGQPHFRKPLMLRDTWDLEYLPIEDTFYHLYVFTKMQ